MTESNPALGSVARRTAVNAAASAAAQVAGKVATLAWTVVAARTLGEAEFGVFFYALSLGLLLTAVATWGFSPVMVMQGSRDRAGLPAAYTRSLTWQLTIAVPVLVAGTLVAGSGRTDNARTVIALVLGATLLDLWSEAARAASAAAQDQLGTAKALVVQRLATVALVTGALVAGTGLVGLAVGYLAGSLVGVVTHSRAIGRLGVRWERSAVTWPEMTAFLRLTPVLGLVTVLLMALFRMDAIILGELEGDAAVGTYAAAYRLLETVLFIAFSLRAAVLPVMTESRDPAVARRALEKVAAVLGLCYLPFAAICLIEATPLLDLIYGAGYAEQSTGALRWLAVAPLVYAVAFLGNAALQAGDHFGMVLIGAAVAAVTNLGLNLTLIPHYGGTAAAFATTAAYAVESVIVIVALRRRGIHARVGRPLLAPILATVAMTAVLLLPLPLLIELPLGGVAFLGIWVLTARRFAPDQLAMLTHLTRRGH